MTDNGAPATHWYGALGWRSVAVAAGAATIGLVALVALHDPAPPASRFVVGEAADPKVVANVDPLRAALVQCRTMSPGTPDPGCEAAWEINRRRFMGERRSDAPSLATIPAPAAPTAAAPAKTQER